MSADECPCAPGLEPWIDGVWRWWVYSPRHKVELMSHAVRLKEGGWLVFDPIGLGEDGLEQFERGGGVEAVVLTNGNHERAAAGWRSRFGCPVYGPEGVAWELGGVEVADPAWMRACGWEAVPLTGGGPGETAWRCRGLDLVVFGDAVVNLRSRGLELLPDKYCADAGRLADGVARLAAEGFGRALFAHGEPIGREASGAVAAMLAARGRSVPCHPASGR